MCVFNNLQIEVFLALLNLLSVTNEQNEKLIAEIKKEELYSIIGGLKANKSPGTDGFTSEWYKSMQEQTGSNTTESL